MSKFCQAMPVDWIAPGETVTVEVERHAVAIANVDGSFWAFAHECPHQGTPLGGVALQRGRLIRCPEHGSIFDVITGQCVLASQDGWSGQLPTYETRVVDGVVEVAIPVIGGTAGLCVRRAADVYSGACPNDEGVRMPVARLGDQEIAYETIGDGQPWAITPGGRFSKDYGGVRELAQSLAERGRKALIWDRPNCGESSVNFTGVSESVMQADTLAALLRHLDFGPTIIIGGSGGARISLLTAARNPDIAAGLGIWWISGGPYGNMTLANVYCWPSLTAVWNGTMQDVANLETWEEVVRRNPSNRERFLAQDRDEFRETMQRWGHMYCACGDPLVPGLTNEEATAMTVPILIFRSGASDMYHTRATSERLAATLPNTGLVEPPWGDREWIERTESATAGGTLFDRWHLLAPQLVEWADETVKR